MNASHSPGPNHRAEYGLRVSNYDRVLSMVLAAVLLAGVAVIILLALWLTSRLFLGQAAVPVVMEQIGSGDSPLSDQRDLEMPDADQTDLAEPEMTERLASIADAVSSRSALLGDPSLGQSGRQGGGDQGGAERRWELTFIQGNTLEVYARQLDFFRIELGVLERGNRITYVSNLAQPKPDTRVGVADAETRYYLTWRGGELVEADRQLLARAGVESNGRLILKLLPPEVEGQLAQLEKTHAGNEAEQVRRTRFGISPDGDGYRFRVIDQTFR
ncbi:MAG: hypothetical protein U1E05_21435 [Patescibacteria group bacterium]|nr:hypothetical protein [Patescibacteria group bacterium]